MYDRERKYARVHENKKNNNHDLARISGTVAAFPGKGIPSRKQISLSLSLPLGDTESRDYEKSLTFASDDERGNERRRRGRDGIEGKDPAAMF